MSVDIDCPILACGGRMQPYWWNMYIDRGVLKCNGCGALLFLKCCDNNEDFGYLHIMKCNNKIKESLNRLGNMEEHEN